MDKLEELLPGIDDFLVNTLGKEKLSSLAERKRQYYIERLEVLQTPPRLPPRPLVLHDSSPSPTLPPRGCSSPKKIEAPLPPVPTANFKPKSRKSLLPRPHIYNAPKIETSFEVTSKNEPKDEEDFAAKQRRIARETTSKIVPEQSVLSAPIPEPIDSDHYSDIGEDVSNNEKNDSASKLDDMYEVPSSLQGDTSSTTSSVNPVDKSSQKETESADESGTSYESYENEQRYEYNMEHSQKIGHKIDKKSNQEDIPLPRLKSKRKKKKFQKENRELAVKTMQNVICHGELYQKRKVMWTKRFCMLSEKRLLCYNTDRDLKPVIVIPLKGCDITYLEKEGRRNHVIRIGHPGLETHWFTGERRADVDYWFEHLMSEAEVIMQEAAVTEVHSETSLDQFVDVDPSMFLGNKEIGSTSSLFIDSEEDSTDNQLSPVSVAPADMKNKKGISDKLSSLFSIGKKRGKKLSQASNMDVETVEGSLYSPVAFDSVTADISIAGRFNVRSRQLGSQEWEEMYCQVKNGLFEVYKHHTDNNDTVAFPLFGCDITGAPETNKDLAIKIEQGGKEKIIIEPSNSLEQGNWLNVLIKATSHTSPPADKTSTQGYVKPASVPSTQLSDSSNEAMGYEPIYEESTLTESFLKALEECNAGCNIDVQEKSESARIEAMYDQPADDEDSSMELALQDYIRGDTSALVKDNVHPAEHVYDDVSMNSTSESTSTEQTDDKQIYESCFEKELENNTACLPDATNKLGKETAQYKENPLRNKEDVSIHFYSMVSQPFCRKEELVTRGESEIKNIEKDLFGNERKLDRCLSKQSLDRNMILKLENSNLYKSYSESHLEKMSVSYKYDCEDNLIKAVVDEKRVGSKKCLPGEINVLHNALFEVTKARKVTSICSVDPPEATNSKLDEIKTSDNNLTSAEESNMYAMPNKAVKWQKRTEQSQATPMRMEYGDVYEDSNISPPPKINLSDSTADVSSKKKDTKKLKRISRVFGREKKINHSENPACNYGPHKLKPKNYKDSTKIDNCILDRGECAKIERCEFGDSEESIDEINQEEMKKLKIIICDLKTSITEMKQKRIAAKEQKSLAKTHNEKKDLDEEYRYVDNQYKNLERELEEAENKLMQNLRTKATPSSMSRSAIRKSMREVKSRVQERLKQYKSRRTPQKSE